MAKLKNVALCVTTKCSHNCDFCSVTEPDTERVDGDIKTLRRIGDRLRKFKVENVELVGGDPAEHAQISELVQHLAQSELKVSILSNTHKYRDKDILKHVSALETTIHGTPILHDNFTAPGAFQRVIANLMEYDRTRRSDQQLGITLNFTKDNCANIYSIVKGLTYFVKIDYVQVQRIGPYGRAADRKNEFRLTVSELDQACYDVLRVNEDLGIRLDIVDAFPLCLVPEQCRKYMGKCTWGEDTACIDMNGDISRCGVNVKPLGNILDSSTSLKKIWEEHPELLKFRKKEYLGESCKKCEMLADCGGGCPVSRGGGAMHDDDLLSKYHAMFKKHIVEIPTGCHDCTAFEQGFCPERQIQFT